MSTVFFVAGDHAAQIPIGIEAFDARFAKAPDDADADGEGEAPETEALSSVAP